MLEHLTATEQWAVFRAADPLRLPEYKGSTFRGALGHAFKQVACALRTRTCDTCLLRSRCAYSVCFETPVPEGARIMRKYPYAPHPFVLEPPVGDRRDYGPGEELVVGLYLVGRAAEYLPHFIYAFDEMGRAGLGRDRGKATLARLCTRRDGETEILYDETAQQLAGSPRDRCRAGGGPRRGSDGPACPRHLRDPHAHQGRRPHDQRAGFRSPRAGPAPPHEHAPLLSLRR